jgi:hypothetical protein
MDMSTIFPSGISACEHISSILYTAPLVTIKGFVVAVVFVNIINDVLVLSENDEDDEIRQVNRLRMKSYGISSNLR